MQPNLTDSYKASKDCVYTRGSFCFVFLFIPFFVCFPFMVTSKYLLSSEVIYSDPLVQ